ncbi:MAG: MBL fold metallo-hydrolase [Methylococcaceae bacterium]|nr:MBL fold metallo-hydrolase [Methylococcaceae bacterium]
MTKSSGVMAKLTFLGAIRQVTGSCYLLETQGRRILLECGMFQGDPSTTAQNHRAFPFAASSLDAVVVSHAHIDHSGLLPKLAQAGYAGPVYVTAPTFDLLELMLKDAAYLELKDSQWENKWRQRAGKKPVAPLYTLEDVEALLTLRRPLPYNDEVEILPGVRLQFHDGGHIIGAAIVELTLSQGNRTRTLVFSGDLGNRYSPLMRDPEVLNRADVLLLESTYGDRDHRSLPDTLNEFRQILKEAGNRGGNVLIPAFAVGRTQDVIYWLGRFQRDGHLPQLMVFLDSPMAIEANGIYADYAALFNRDDPEFNRAMEQGWQAWLPNLRYSKSTEESMALNQVQGAIIIAGSGMCEGGRIRHHLKYHLWKNETHLLITGFQPQGTLGRKLVDGARHLAILGSEIAVRAEIHTLGGFSAHAGQSQLLQWAQGFAGSHPRLYLVHGEYEAMQSLQTRLAPLNLRAEIPTVGATIAI